MKRKEEKQRREERLLIAALLFWLKFPGLNPKSVNHATISTPPLPHTHPLFTADVNNNNPSTPEPGSCQTRCEINRPGPTSRCSVPYFPELHAVLATHSRLLLL